MYDAPRIHRGHVRPLNTTDERSAAIVRGVLLDRIDDVLGAHVGSLSERFGLSRGRWLELVQLISLALFPEELAEDATAEILIAEMRAKRQADTAREAATHARSEADRRECLDLADRMDDVAAQVARGGLVPAGGKIERVGVARLRVFAEVLERAAG